MQETCDVKIEDFSCMGLSPSGGGFNDGKPAAFERGVRLRQRRCATENKYAITTSTEDRNKRVGSVFFKCI